MHMRDALKKLKSTEDLFKASMILGKDALIFVAEKGLIEEFLDFHVKRQQERNKKNDISSIE